MEVEFRTTADDYIAFYRYFFFRRKLTLRVVYWGLICLVIGYGFNNDQSRLSRTFIFAALGSALAVILFIFVIPYYRTIHRFWKALKGPGKVDQPKRIVVTADGFTLQWIGEGIESRPVGHYWADSIKGVEETDRFVIILLHHGFPVVIPKSYFPDDNEFSNFMGMLNYGMAKFRMGWQAFNRAKERRTAYWGLLGLIPNVGVIVGVVLLIQGVFRYRSWRLIVIGAGDILFTVVFWTVFTQWTMTSPTFTIPMKQFAKAQLNTVFKSVEFYKLQHGQYPDSLRQVEDIKGNVWITDPIIRKGMKTVNFYYEKTGDKYWLFSVGEDGKPFTADDIFPTMNARDSTKFGLRLH